ncbi:MAG: flagellar assembly protein FliW [Vicinamibacterales bacterium]|nr:flagellar assembly protein FliW [Vicinamibacterales bacterium]
MDAQRLVSDPDRLRVETRFGDFETDRSSVIAFPEGLPGFEQCRRFVVIAADDIAPLQCLHAVDGPPASFLTIDPRLVLPGYRCQLSAHDATRLGATEGSALLWLSIVTVQPDGVALANLRAPIVINPATMAGFQLMPHNTLYPLRQPITA